MSIHKKMVAIMSEIGSIGKDQTNQAQRFNYRGIDDVYNALHSIMAKHGVFSVPSVVEKSREERVNKNGTVLAFTTITMKYTFYAEDGSSVECIVEGEGMDSGDKSSNKAMAVAHKYALLQCFCIPTAEQKDPDAESYEVTAKQPDPEIVAKFEQCKDLKELQQVWSKTSDKKLYEQAKNEAKERLAA